MKRLALAFVLLLSATGLSAAPEKWWDAYARGVAAVNAKNYKLAADSLQKSIGEMPNEGMNVRTRKELITYVPHFWLGIAKFNLGDPDGALREWRISEEQGVVAKTEYYSRMKDWVARAQAQKQRNAQDGASGAKKSADTAISKALEVQLGALSAGGDRAESYLNGQRKLMEARAQFQKAGTDVNAYKAAEQTAQQAASLFSSAAEEGKKLRAQRASVPAPRKPAPAPVKTAQVIPVMPAPVKLDPQAASLPKPQSAISQDVLTSEEVTKRIEEQEAKRKKLEEAKKAEETKLAEAKKSAAAPVVVTAAPLPPVSPAPEQHVQPELRRAYRAFAAGDLTASEQLLTGILKTQPAAAEAYLLRGCARYTQAMLSRTPDPLLAAASNDFRAALQRNGALRLGRDEFSPKLIAFFEQVRRSR